MAAQEEDHRKKTFQEEYRAFLKEYEIEFDEHYLVGTVSRPRVSDPRLPP